MSSIAPTGADYADYGKHRVSTLPRAGAILIALLITAAGIAPLFSQDKETAVIDSGIRQESSAPAASEPAAAPAAADTAPAEPRAPAATPADTEAAPPEAPATPAP